MQNEIMQAIKDFDDTMKARYLESISVDIKNLVLILFPATSAITGGMISILNIANVSRQLVGNEGCKVQVAYYPGQRASCFYRRCKNEEIILNFSDIADNFPNVEHLIIHIPEYVTEFIFKDLSEKESNYLKNIENLQINIMNQNICGMPDPSKLEYLKEFTENITQTTAHHRYTNQEICDRWAYPLYAIYPIMEPESYIQSEYEAKQNIICYSKDQHPMKEAILNKLRIERPEFQLVEIKDITFEQYKQLISDAKYTITFGEGCDGYFSEPIASGSLSFSVYNDVFFPSEKYKTFKNVYSSYNEMLESICSDIDFFENNVDEYKNLSATVLKELYDIYKMEDYFESLCNFYNGVPTFTPSKSASEKNLSEIK